MKITPYIPFIKEQFQEIKNEYNMIWGDINNEYHFILQNETTLIEFITNFREEGLNIAIIDKKNKTYFSVHNIKKSKGNNDTHFYLTAKEKNQAIKLKGSYNYIIYIYSKMLQNHCQDMLSGDFSSIEPGNPN